jgi:glycosyltransferase involved in cell wall biosynthesis
MQKILLGIPVFNESKTLKKLFNQIDGAFNCDILFVDDGSSDNSANIISKFNNIKFLQHQSNEGYGQTLIDIFSYSIKNNYDFLITIDADGQHEIAHIENFINQISEDKIDIISGSRYLQEFKENLTAPSDRYEINQEFTHLINKITNFSLTDSFCGMKAYKVSSLKKLNLTEKGYAFPIEFWLEANRQSLTVKETPIKRIYSDLNRCFGGELDEPQNRRNYYFSVFINSIGTVKIESTCKEKIKV